MTDNAPRPNNSSNVSAPDWDAIARFLSGESPAEEAANVGTWLEAHPADRSLVERLGQSVTLPVADLDVEAALGQVKARFDQEPAVPRLSVTRTHKTVWRARYVAPVLFLAAAVAFAAIVLRPSAAGKDHPPVTAVAQTYTTAVGHRDSITLADGSHVILGPDSRLTVASDYGTGARSVELHGDGYFDVRHDAAKPFTVRVARAVIEDIGTTFAVESDAGDTTTVAVMSGSVRLRASDSSANSGALLSAGDRGSMSADGRVRAFPHSVSDDAAWTTGRLVFREASLARVAGEIHRWYGISLRIEDSSLVHRHVTATFNGEPVDQVLKIIGLALGARIERQGDSATVISNRGSATAR
jgi:transmembrane sensor